MTYRLPPLNALRAFEAAARHLSFKTAAVELHVTPGAVSQQVRSLERTLGVALFDRVHQGLMLTDAGQRYLTPLRTAFDVISIATQSVMPRSAGENFVIATVPEFAFYWLVPALQGFQDAHPAVQLKIAEAASPDAVLRGKAHMTLLPGVSSHPELTATPIVDDRRFPAEAPGTGPGGQSSLAERLAAATLLVADDDHCWRQWLGAVGAARLESLNRIAFARRDLAVRAAELARGVVLASSVEDLTSLTAGRLVPVCDGPEVIVARWYALCPPGRLACPEEAAVLAWLARAGAPLAEAAARSESAA